MQAEAELRKALRAVAETAGLPKNPIEPVPVNPSNPADPHLEQAQGRDEGPQVLRSEGPTTVQESNRAAEDNPPAAGRAAATGSDLTGTEALERALQTLGESVQRAAQAWATVTAAQAEKLALAVERWVQTLDSPASTSRPSDGSEGQS